jgi:hypothetical protein
LPSQCRRGPGIINVSVAGSYISSNQIPSDEVLGPVLAFLKPPPDDFKLEEEIIRPRNFDRLK